MTRIHPKSDTTINDLMAEADEVMYKNKRARTKVEKLA
jgi:PleD family two-component response regulator